MAAGEGQTHLNELVTTPPSPWPKSSHKPMLCALLRPQPNAAAQLSSRSLVNTSNVNIFKHSLAFRVDPCSHYHPGCDNGPRMGLVAPQLWSAHSYDCYRERIRNSRRASEEKVGWRPDVLRVYHNKTMSQKCLPWLQLYFMPLFHHY